MTNLISKGELRTRLDNLGKQLIEAEGKLAGRGSRPGGTHMGHLVELKDRHNFLKEQIETADDSLWEKMKQTWHEDMEGLLDSFAEAVKYEDEEFRRGKG